ncbi:ABC transporter permease [Peterkaempfera bronchialis]|uniref:ABC transporter permease n=1 Tax=Peterkaempfera bronchialis TaxID=2126346 RepID=A0A345T143_9ACTN|nr:ABC transporter permease [Peterkaempfera bronchialis]AXI79698.1 ABC transporter permease [Peterkaempfera bronchialis]
MSETAIGPQAVPERHLEHHLFRAQRAGLPQLPVYFGQLWQRRQFVHEMARSTLRAQNYTSFFGQLWLVINPLLLGCVYYVLVDILGGGTHQPDYFAKLLAGLFAFYFFSGCLGQCAGSVIGSSRLIMNSSFPRLLLPITQIVIAFMRFLPSMVVFLVVHQVEGLPWAWAMLWALPAFGCLVLFGAGLGFLAATVQVYFRDFANFLPYMIRIWLFLSPVLWVLEDQIAKGGRKALLMSLNPLSPMLGTWGDALVRGRFVHPEWLLQGGCWAVGAFLVGALVFMWREREFAVRL